MGRVALAFGQTQPPADISTSRRPTVFRDGVTELEVPVGVRDSRGLTVVGLQRQEFRVLTVLAGIFDPVSRGWYNIRVVIREREGRVLAARNAVVEARAVN